MLLKTGFCRRLVGTFAALTVGAALSSSPAPAAKKLSVIASFSIIGDFAAEVGGDRIELRTLLARTATLTFINQSRPMRSHFPERI